MIEENIRRKKSKEISDTQQDDEGGHWKRGEREGFSKCWKEKGGREDKGSGSVRVISRVIFTLFTVRVRVIFTVEQLWWEATVEEVDSLQLLSVKKMWKKTCEAKKINDMLFCSFFLAGHLPPNSTQ